MRFTSKTSDATSLLLAQNFIHEAKSKGFKPEIFDLPNCTKQLNAEKMYHIFGLPGSGKTHLSLELEKLLLVNILHIDDITRHSYFHSLLVSDLSKNESQVESEHLTDEFQRMFPFSEGTCIDILPFINKTPRVLIVTIPNYTHFKMVNALRANMDEEKFEDRDWFANSIRWSQFSKTEFLDYVQASLSLLLTECPTKQEIFLFPQTVTTQPLKPFCWH